MYQDMMDTIGFVEQRDPEVGAAMRDELHRQQRNIELIASENFVSPAVMAAMGSVLTNKYAEGYPGKRYYGGCQCVDVVENIARRACEASFLAPTMPTYSPTRAHRRTWRYISRFAPARRYRPGDESCPRRAFDSWFSGQTMSGNLISTLCPTALDDNGYIDYDNAAPDCPRECQPKLIVAGASAYSPHHSF